MDSKIVEVLQEYFEKREDIALAFLFGLVQNTVDRNVLLTMARQPRIERVESLIFGASKVDEMTQ